MENISRVSITATKRNGQNEARVGCTLGSNSVAIPAAAAAKAMKPAVAMSTSTIAPVQP